MNYVSSVSYLDDVKVKLEAMKSKKIGISKLFREFVLGYEFKEEVKPSE